MREAAAAARRSGAAAIALATAACCPRPAVAVACTSPDCSGHGVCSLGGRCVCSQGYYGDACDLGQEECDATLCNARGACAANSSGIGTLCQCGCSWTGSQCADCPGDNCSLPCPPPAQDTRPGGAGGASSGTTGNSLILGLALGVPIGALVTATGLGVAYRRAQRRARDATAKLTAAEQAAKAAQEQCKQWRTVPLQVSPADPDTTAHSPRAPAAGGALVVPHRSYSPPPPHPGRRRPPPRSLSPPPLPVQGSPEGPCTPPAARPRPAVSPLLERFTPPDHPPVRSPPPRYGGSAHSSPQVRFGGAEIITDSPHQLQGSGNLRRPRRPPSDAPGIGTPLSSRSPAPGQSPPPPNRCGNGDVLALDNMLALPVPAQHSVSAAHDSWGEKQRRYAPGDTPLSPSGLSQ
eukprot:TRINITY_DN12356_c0_g1_i1.p1 TRINITY_DN12356_c0_g1~~TRINITY_DN12356_c0_g1_i1.p1  ORF type:complete len:434 (+),score=87.51 TRINITY_DN12356_c0_g1_i1:82-1302(+)